MSIYCIPQVEKASNQDKVLGYLVQNGHISPGEARMVFGIERLAPRIHELREFGYEIETTHAIDEAGKGYTRYVLHQRHRA